MTGTAKKMGKNAAKRELFVALSALFLFFVIVNYFIS